jgi:imidazolonepropionase-like amidohydrolase
MVLMPYYGFNKFTRRLEMETQLIVVDSYFDGKHYRNKGPYTIELQEGIIRSIGERAVSPDIPGVKRASFAMPGLVEAHCHLFLDGGELDFAKRSDYLKSPREKMLEVGYQSLAQSLAAGITLIRDAGDIHGINLQLREELRSAPSRQPSLRCPGTAIRKAKRYGSFMAREVTDETSLEAVMSAVGALADAIKVLMTGIIDFEAGQVKGTPQFNLEETRRIAASAKKIGRLTFAHCSGADGIDIALQGGLDSIEHGFFVTREQLQVMADKGITWVPTFSPVHFQWLRPELAGWDRQTRENLRTILDAHGEQLAYAYQIGVPVLVGSDAGSHGVEHGRSYINELQLMAATGVDLERVLHSATTLPRSLWGCDPVDIAEGCRAELVLLNASPFTDITALQEVTAVYKEGWCNQVQAPGTVAA